MKSDAIRKARFPVGPETSQRAGYGCPERSLVLTRLQGFFGLFSALLAGLFAFTGEALANNRPNIVVVQVDDMARSLLGPTLRDGRPAMPNLQGLIAGQGANFTNYYNTMPSCSPSRSALLSGQYGRNSGVVGNGGDFGGWGGWRGADGGQPSREIMGNNLATRLQGVGYHTARFGKFMNNFDEDKFGPLEVPPGWNTFVADSSERSNHLFYGNTELTRIERKDESGEVFFKQGSERGEPLGPFGNPDYADNRDTEIDPRACKVGTEMADGRNCFYQSDRMTRLAADEIREVDGPLFLQVDYHAPHADYSRPFGPQPATRHLRLADGVSLPNGPAFNEKNTSDKDFLIQRDGGVLKRPRINRIEQGFQNALASMRGVDEGIGYLYDTLEDTGKLEDTYFIFVSDNGFFYGEQRFSRGKTLPYEAPARVPLMIRGPGIAGETEVRDLVNTADLAPTILDAAEVEADEGYVLDGKSLLPSLRGEAGGRRALVIENISATEMKGNRLARIPKEKLDRNRPAAQKPPFLFYRALRIGRHKYINYTQGGEELYDLRRDPHELYNQARNPEYLELLDYMRAMLERYRDCAGPSCLAEPDDPPKPGRFLLDARRPPARLSTKVAYLYKDTVHARLECRSPRPCRETVAVRYRGERVTESVTVRVRAGQGQRVRLPATSTGEVRLQRASEREARIELRRSSSDPVSGTKIRVSRPVLRQN